MTKMNTCPECGGSMPPDAPGGACPRCLLATGLLDDDAAGDDVDPGDESALELEPADDGNADAQPVGGDATESPRVARNRPAPPSVDEIATHFPTLVVEELIGVGGMGIVYRARQTSLDRPVALKVLWPELAANPAFAERFGREARAMARLDHPHIVRVYEFGERDGFYYLVMEFIDGKNLRELMDAGGVEPEEALAIVPQICAALQFAHDQGVVHRDIKPANVLVDTNGRVRIADFGLAKLMEGEDHTLTQAGQVMGTLHYMAPEQYTTPETVDHRADIYSLGVVFYEMLTGDMPVGRFPAPSKKVHVDVRLDGIVLRSLEREPELRYQRASDIGTAVTNVSAIAAPSAEISPDVAPEMVAQSHVASDAVETASATPREPSRLSKFAVIAALGVIAQLGFTILGFFAPPFLVVSLVVALAATLAGVVAWLRIGVSKGRLHGHLFAASATFLPLLVGCGGTLLLAFSVAREGVQRSGPIEVGPNGVRVGELVIDDDGVHFGDWIDIDDGGVTVTEPFEIDEGGVRRVPGPPVPSQPAAVEDPDGVFIQFGHDSRAAFVTGGPPWMDNSDRASRVGTLARLWDALRSWRRESPATRFSAGRFYRVNDHREMRQMPEDEYERRLAAHDLGLPLLLIDRNVDDALHEFELERIDIDESGERLSALARSATTTLRFGMVRERTIWKFVVGPVERTRIDAETR